jgi:hypothetical protein
MARELLSQRRGAGGKIELSTVSEFAHPIIRVLDITRVNQQITTRTLTYQAGVATSLWHHWTAARRQPRLADLEAVANVLGLTLCTKELTK